MAAVAFAIPIVPGKEKMDRDAFEEMKGSRLKEYEEARRAAGIMREAVWHQETPQGTLAVVYMEAEDVGAAMHAIGTLRCAIRPLVSRHDGAGAWHRSR